MNLYDPYNVESRKAERRRYSKSPAGIRASNRKKGFCHLEFQVSEDAKTLKVRTGHSRRPIDVMLIDMFHDKIGGDLYQMNGGGYVLEITLNAKAAAKNLKFKAIPAECRRCEGNGEINNPAPNPLEEFAEDGVVNMSKVPQRGLDTEWCPFLRCPACHGSGRALTEET